MTKHLTSILLLLAACSTAWAADWYASTNGTGVGTNWATAGSLTGMVAGASSGDVVWVNNGVYKGTDPYPDPYTAFLFVGDGVTVRSKDNDPATVTLDGDWFGGVVSNKPSSWIIGCTIANGYIETAISAAGIAGGFAANCIINGCQSYIANGAVGGAVDCTLYNCTLINNTGGNNDTAGAENCTLYNCIIENNSAPSGVGGSKNSTLYNCLISKNTGGGGAAGAYSTFYNCTIVGNMDEGGGAGGYVCTYVNSIEWDNQTPAWEPVSDSFSCGSVFTNSNSTTNDPMLIDSTNGNYRLQSGSPCINTGTNGAWTTGAKDLDDNLRIWPKGGTVDMGAYEYGSQVSYSRYFILSGTGLGNIRGTSLGALKGNVYYGD